MEKLQYFTQLENPSDPSSIRITERTITGGSGQFQYINWGYVDAETTNQLDEVVTFYYTNFK